MKLVYPDPLPREQGERRPCPELSNSCKTQLRERFAEQSSGVGQARLWARGLLRC